MSELTTEQALRKIQDAAERGEPVDLRGRDLRGIDLSRETVQKYADKYPKAIFNATGGINLEKARLEKAVLWNGHLDGAYLLEAHLEGAKLDGAHLEGAVLHGAHLGEAYLGGTHLEGAELARAHLERAFLRRAHLDETRLVGAHLERADLVNTPLRGVRFFGADLDRTHFTVAELGWRVERRGDEEVVVQDKLLIGEEADGRWTDAKETYLAIKQNFQSLGRYEDARWAYVKERQMERKSYSLGLRWAGSLFLDWLALYGESWKRPLFIWMPIWLVLFALVYLFVPGAMEPSGPLSPERAWNAFVFSTRCFATLSFTGLAASPSLEPGPEWWAAILPSFEAMLGVSTLALVMYCLGRRMSGS